ncbi:MAG: hypothetical protein KDB00_06020, partial [Planctomycetales bacterium]|nr:hypothetical protein [Planctomycetales bacterium]
MAADVTIGPLPGMTEVLIEPTADCYASTNGVYDDGGGDETQSLGPWERPTTQIATQPLAAINGLMDGAWTIQEYTAIVNDLRVTDAYGATVECYYINRTSLSQDKIFLGISTDIGGSLQLLTGNEPMFWPYFVKIVYKVYTNGSGDCILRIAALILPRASIPEPTTPSLPPRSLYFGFENVGTAYNWPHTTTAFQYSDFNPCAEDMGFNAGAWVSGNNYELLDGPIVASEGVTASGPNGLYALADLTQSDEVVVLEETPTGSAPALGLLW